MDTTIGKCCPKVSSEERMRGARRESEPPSDQVPGDGSKESGKYDDRGDIGDINHAFSNRFCNGGSDDKHGNKIKKCCPEYCHTRREYASRDDRGNRIGCIMHPIGIIKCKSHKYDKGNKRVVGNEMKEEFHKSVG